MKDKEHEITSISKTSMHTRLLIAQWAVVNLVERKGIITQEELMAEMYVDSLNYEKYPAF